MPRHHVRNPRRLGDHVQAVRDHLDTLGAADVDLRQNKHLVVRWTFNGRPMHVSMAVTPRDPGRTAVNIVHLISRKVRLAASHLDGVS